MHKVIFIFNIEEIRWHLRQRAQEQLLKNPKIGNYFNINDIEKAWFLNHLSEYHFLLFNRSKIDVLLSLLDQSFLKEETFLMSRLYKVFSKVLHPIIHPYFSQYGELGLDGSGLWIKYSIDESLIR